ncbi:MAG: nucleotidyltransferase domain-containing protein [Gammaproteobacteria bacterium]|nr:nucleotidyltransferase domain-containing protein [Gammaproteobacteria bacterium]
MADSLAPLNESIELAYVFGSMASGQERSGSDVDLLLVGGELEKPNGIGTAGVRKLTPA